MFNNFKYFQPGIKDIVYLILMMLVGLALSLGLGLVFKTVFSKQTAYVLQIIISSIVTYAVPFCYALWRNKRLKATAKPVLLDSLDGLSRYAAVSMFIGMVGAVALAYCFCALRSLFPVTKLTNLAYEMITDIDMFWPYLFVECILAPVFLCWFSCGMCYRGLVANGFKPWLAVVIGTVAVFIMSFSGFDGVMTAVMAAYLMYIYSITRSMSLVIESFICSTLLEFFIMHYEWTGYFTGPKLIIFLGALAILASSIYYFYALWRLRLTTKAARKSTLR